MRRERLQRRVGVPVILLLASLAAAACPATVADLDAHAEAALAAYAELDLERFERAEAALLELAACLDEPVTPGAAWDLHVVHGLGAWIDRDGDAARAAFRGARATLPSGDLSPLLAPDGSHARALWVAAGVEGGGAAAQPPRGRWAVDGALDVAEVPTERAVVVQRLTQDGRVRRSWYFPGGADLAALRKEARLTSRPRLVAAGGLALGGSAALATAAGLHALYLSAPDTFLLEDVVTANAVLGAAGFVALGAAATVLTVEVVQW